MNDYVKKISSIIDQDDKILWIYAVKAKRTFLVRLLVISIVITSIFLGLEIWFLIVTLASKSFNISSFSSSIYLAGFIIFLLIEYLKEKKMIKDYNLSSSEVKNYQKIFILTHKWWIQKDAEFRRSPPLDIKEYTEDTYKFKDDIFFLNIDCIIAIDTNSNHRKHRHDQGYIDFFLDRNILNPSNKARIRVYINDLSKLKILVDILRLKF